MSDTIKYIGYVINDFDEKFGVPRQSGMTDAVTEIVFYPPYDVEEAYRDIEKFSHLWLIWRFDVKAEFSPTVRPPKMGGNKRVGVFATRSPFRPNAIGMSAVKLVQKRVENGKVALFVSGADLKNGTRIIDVKPYLPYADSIADAVDGFESERVSAKLRVIVPPTIAQSLGEEKTRNLIGALSLDPRPGYKKDGETHYAFRYGGKEIKFRVDGGVLTVTDAE
jgi:tRNA-Thr(GGU) m(6)t(6)A37 methyltransferase TsaA